MGLQRVGDDWATELNWKSSISGCLIKWLQIKKKKKSLFWTVVFSHSTQQQTMSQSDCDVWWKMDCIQLVMIRSVAGPRSSKVLPKAKLAPKKVMVPVWCCHSDPLQLSESWPNHYIWEVCSANWWDVPKMAMPPTSTGQQNRPNSFPWQHPTTCHTSNASKVEQIGLWSFASSAVIT